MSFIQEKGTGQEIPDPPRYINFCRGDLNDTASESSEDDSYSVAQFPRNINPAFRSSSPQPSMFESHHDPQSDLAIRMGNPGYNTPPSRETTMTPQKAAQPPPTLDYRQNPQLQANTQPNIDDIPPIPHNEYPADGMTMFCRAAPQSDRSSATSPERLSSEGSHRGLYTPSSLSSQEPVSGKQSPVKQIVGNGPEKQVQKKRSGFFSNSPFRRKSKHEKEGRERGPSSVTATPTSRNTWGSSNSRNSVIDNPSPSRNQPHSNGFQGRDRSRSPEPVGPGANFQLNVGPNVFDVASPDVTRTKGANKPTNSSSKELDPIAQALADLKGVNKQSSVRMSADRYHGIATPAPGDRSAAQRGTPPPSYDQPGKRLDAPKPAFTSAQMQQTTRKYVGQTQDMYGSSRPGTRGAVSEMPRTTSPRPMRSVSPKPGYNGSSAGYNRSTSPSLYNNASRTRQTPNGSPSKQTHGNGMSYSRQNSPNDVARAPSPQPQYARSERPNSSGGDMALQLSDGGIGSARGGRSAGRPMSYYGAQQPLQPIQNGGRTRSKSVANARQYTDDGRPILQFGMCIHKHLANPCSNFD